MEEELSLSTAKAEQGDVVAVWRIKALPPRTLIGPGSFEPVAMLVFDQIRPEEEADLDAQEAVHCGADDRC